MVRAPVTSGSAVRGHLCRLPFGAPPFGRPVALMVEAFEEELGSADDLIGSAVVDFAAASVAATGSDMVVQLTSAGPAFAPAGSVRLLLSTRLADNQADPDAMSFGVSVLDAAGLPGSQRNVFVKVDLVDIGGRTLASSRTGRSRARGQRRPPPHRRREAPAGRR